MSKNEQMKIAPRPLEEREGWDTLETWLEAYSEETLVEMLHRYMDAQCHAKNYRQRAAIKTKAMRSQIEALAASKGMTLEQFLESQS